MTINWVSNSDDIWSPGDESTQVQHSVLNNFTINSMDFFLYKKVVCVIFIALWQNKQDCQHWGETDPSPPPLRPVKQGTGRFNPVLEK